REDHREDFGFTARMPMWPSSSVVPSGAARATKVAPIEPPAPGRLSTITARPSVGAILSATDRARMSVSPPGVNGTTIEMLAEGQAGSADAMRGAIEAAAAAEASFRTSRRSTADPRKEWASGPRRILSYWKAGRDSSTVIPTHAGIQRSAGSPLVWDGLLLAALSKLAI